MGNAAGNSGVGRGIVRAGMAVALAHFFFKVSGLIQLKVMGHYFSSRVVDVVYVTAFEACVFAMFLIGEETIGPAFLPVFMRQLDTRSEKDAWSVANIVLSV